MNGKEFYETLTRDYSKSGQRIYSDFIFNKWLPKPGNKRSFQFKVPKRTPEGGYYSPKSIPQQVLITAWKAGAPITNDWLERNGYPRYKDCRLSILNYLLRSYDKFR